MAEGKYEKWNGRKMQQEIKYRDQPGGGSVAAVGRIVHVVHGIQVGIACAIAWCAGLRSSGTDRMHIPRWPRSRGCQTVGALGVAHGRI